MSRLLVLIFAISMASMARADGEVGGSNSTKIEAPTVGSNSSDSIYIGHNLSPAYYTLKKSKVTLGNFVAGVGLNDNIMIGTSPWLIVSYNMPNAFIRMQKKLNDSDHLGFQAAYFKTQNYYPDQYQMEAASAWAIWSRQFSPNYTLHVDANYMYFFDETIPFSLRRDPQNDNPYQISLTTLNEIRVLEHIGFGIEVGFLGLNYTYPEIFGGATINYRTPSFLTQVGASFNSTVSGVPEVYTQEQAAGMKSGQQNDLAMHPEIQVQYFF